MKSLPEDFCRLIVEDFLRSSYEAVEKLVETAKKFQAPNRLPRAFFQFQNNKRVNQTFGGDHFFIRGSVEYTNPQLTVEEVQGIIGARLLEVSGNYFLEKGMHQPDAGDIKELCELAKKPRQGKIVSFLLNTDDVEADRYSMNPLKTSIVESGQSAFPAINIKTDKLTVDDKFAAKYEGTLICKKEIELIRAMLEASNGSYLDFVDAVKYEQLRDYCDVFGMDLFLPSHRMPLTTLQLEGSKGPIHDIIGQVHSSYESFKQAYECMGRSMTKRTTLLTIPHSLKGYGSKRAARGRIYFTGEKLESLNVRYKDTLLYPNAMDEQDVSVAKCEDNFNITADKLSHYNYAETPSSPQFFIYSIASPEDSSLWHGVGAFGASQLLQSFSSARKACQDGKLIKNLTENYGIKLDVPLQLNLAPDRVWVHPIHRNIDASIGCVENLEELANMGMKIEFLAKFH
jgi:hypothetical protein